METDDLYRINLLNKWFRTETYCLYSFRFIKMGYPQHIALSNLWDDSSGAAAVNKILFAEHSLDREQVVEVEVASMELIQGSEHYGSGLDRKHSTDSVEAKPVL